MHCGGNALGGITCEDNVGDAAMAAVAQLLGVVQAAMAAREAQEGSLWAAESGAWSVKTTTRAQRAIDHVELLQLGMNQSSRIASLHYKEQ